MNKLTYDQIAEYAERLSPCQILKMLWWNWRDEAKIKILCDTLDKTNDIALAYKHANEFKYKNRRMK
jgi:hypothetical protein